MLILDRLTAMKGRFGRDAGAETAQLLERVQRTRFRDTADLIRLHELVLFLRAYPQSPRVLRLADEILFAFAGRLTGLDREPFEAVEISGIAGTGLSTNFSYEIALSLVIRHGRAIQIDWENYQRPDRLGPVLGKLIPMAGEDASVEPHVDWRRWFEAAHRNLKWLLEQVDPRTYDLLEIPLRWELGDSTASRSHTRIPCRNIYYHQGPLLKRSDVSIESEFAAPRIEVKKLAHSRDILNRIVDTSSVRYRELWGFTHPGLSHVYRAGLGRGVEIVFFGVPPEWRLPLRAYHCGMFFKNGIPLGYVEGLSLFERMEVGFNLYYTFREGETAWLYGRLLKLFREQLGVSCFSVDPYQLGHENDEAIDSGAFWFYRKLGFRTTSEDATRIVEREEARIASDASYRTPAATLRRLARTPLIYGGGPEWDRFEIHHLGCALPRMPAEIMRAKQGPEEARYLRMLRKDAILRRRILSRAGGPADKPD
jgi:hypothetical protein